MLTDKKIVCLGGGIGTVNLIKGLKKYVKNITVIASTADEGGSGGRLRRLYKIPPPGDFVNCMASLAPDSFTSDLLTYRFPGDRYGKDSEILGHKLGNFILTALANKNGNFEEALTQMQKMFQIMGKILPATIGSVSISARTIEGKEVFGEENIDLGKYNGERILEEVFLHPKNPRTPSNVLSAMKEADVLIAGPGDLYTTILPVLIVPEISKLIIKRDVPKIFIINVANKPFETKGYALSDYINAIKRHLGVFPFNKVIVNNNFSVKIPQEYNYSYVDFNGEKNEGYEIIKDDLVDGEFPLYHSADKLAKIVSKVL